MTARTPADAPALIYALVDPRQPEHIRYVGKTCNMKVRMPLHLRLAKTKATNRRLCWIQSVLNAGERPQVLILETVAAGARWQEREIFWIAKARLEGHELTNTTDGGDGGASCRGLKRPPRPPEWSAKISAWHKGKKASQETRAKMSLARKGKAQSPEHVAKRVAAKRKNRIANES